MRSREGYLVNIGRARRWALLWLGHPAETFYWESHRRNSPKPGDLVLHNHDSQVHRVIAVGGDALSFEDGSTGSWAICCDWPPGTRPDTWWGARPAPVKALYLVLAVTAVLALVLSIVT